MDKAKILKTIEIDLFSTKEVKTPSLIFKLFDLFTAGLVASGVKDNNSISAVKSQVSTTLKEWMSETKESNSFWALLEDDKVEEAFDDICSELSSKINKLGDYVFSDTKKTDFLRERAYQIINDWKVNSVKKYEQTKD